MSHALRAAVKHSLMGMGKCGCQETLYNMRDGEHLYSKKSRMAQAEEGLPPYRLVRMPGGRRKPERRQQMDKQKIAKSTMELADMHF